MTTSSSSATLDIKDILAGQSCENLCSVSLVLPSISDDSLSFDDVPPFPSDAKPTLYVNAFDAPTLKTIGTTGNSYAGDAVKAIITVPTGPRLRVMLMEPICIRQWREKVSNSPPLKHVPFQDWNLEEDTTLDFPAPPWLSEGSLLPPELFKAILASRHPERPVQAPMTTNDYQSPLTSPSLSISYQEFSSSPIRACSDIAQPAIHVLDSEGFQASEGMRKQPVPTIMVSSSTAMFSLESSQSLARVPLAVRRGQKVPPPLTLNQIKTLAPEHEPYPDIPTPFLGSPSSSTPTFDFAPNPSTFSMGLEAMCAELRSRCPDVLPETPAQQHLEGHWRTVPCAQYALSGQDEDEWAFAQDLLDKYGDRMVPPLNSPPVESPSMGHTSDVAESPGTKEDSLSWAMSPTLMNSVEQPPASQTQDELKQQRRKTVIIETPTQEGVISSHVELEQIPHELEEHAPLPFESPSDSIFSCTQCRQSTPVQSRPASTASTASSVNIRPVRGILKEKKSVRFSIAPSLHEYPSEEHECAQRSLTEPAQRSSLISRRRSPLRQVFTPDVSEDSPVKENILPRHPAVRAIARHAARPGLASPQTPTPAFLADQKRAPLRSLNARQSLPVKRNSNVVYAEQTTRNSLTTADVGRPRRLKATSTPGYARGQGVENIARRDSTAQKSRMPVPFRTILTKLRA